jgi:hypothetical protein
LGVVGSRLGLLGAVHAVAGLSLIAACGGNSTSSPQGGNDSGSSNQDASNDVTVIEDSGGGGNDAGMEAAPPPECGEAGECCGQPGNTCAPGLYCAGGSVCTPSFCTTAKPTGALPYNIASGFNTVYSIGQEADNFLILTPSAADCNATTYPPILNTGLQADAAALPDGSVYPVLEDGGMDMVTYPPSAPCYGFLFDPSCITGTNGLCWAGAVFTNSAATAATAPSANPSSSTVGSCIAPGATAISFWARASVPGTIVKFGSTRQGACTTQNPIKEADGGIADPTTEQTLCPNDTEFYIQLSTDWQNYWVSLAAGEPYNDEPSAGGAVWNAFSVVVEPQFFAGGAYVFVKDIVWSNPTIGFDGGVVAAPEDAGASDGASGGSMDGSPDGGATDGSTDGPTSG